MGQHAPSEAGRVRCRTGSSETLCGSESKLVKVRCHRQLRNEPVTWLVKCSRSLPHRQLRKLRRIHQGVLTVRCRTGSSEKKPALGRLVLFAAAQAAQKIRQRHAHSSGVRCRTGSSEIGHLGAVGNVRCRTGSSETHGCSIRYGTQSSLPHRQLRNHAEPGRSRHQGSLPHRQLRNATERAMFCPSRSLPHRQLRKVPAVFVEQFRRSLPHRQLRKSHRSGAEHLLFAAAQAAQKSSGGFCTSIRSLPHRQLRKIGAGL